MCGIFGISEKNGEVIDKIIRGNYDQQNRGEQASGGATFDGKKLHWYSDEGLVAEVFSERNKEKWSKLKGNCGIGHNLYSTIGRGGEKKQAKTFQPLIGSFGGQLFALAHNGNLVRLEKLRRKAKKAGYKFKSKVSDTEVIVALLSTSKKKNFLDALKEVLPQLEGAFSLVILYKNKVIGVRDSNGIRPICIGKNSHSYILASESCVFYNLGAHLVREVQPGEVVVLGDGKIERSFRWADKTQLRLCVFEFVYFARPDSIFCGKSVCSYRNNAGEITAREHPVEADMVMPVPESGRIYDHGFSTVSGIPVREGIFRNRYITVKTFLTPRDVDKNTLQVIKLHPLKNVMACKRICLTDDSLIRSYAIRKTVEKARGDGAAVEVHVRVCSPPVKHRCHLGIDMSTKEELIAAQHSAEEICEIICADSLGYLSVEGMIEAIGIPENNLCMGCFTGKYPVDPIQ